MGRELGWDDEIEESGPNFTLLPAGDYNFEVTKFERGRHQGSANLPACNMAILTLKIDGGEHGNTTVIDRLYLHSTTEGFLSNFFESIGQKEEGQRVKMNWNAVFGAKGRCTLEVNRYTNKNGEERENNQVKTFLSYDKYLEHAGQSQQAPPQQATNQAPFPGGSGQAPQQPNQQQQQFTPGSF